MYVRAFTYTRVYSQRGCKPICVPTYRYIHSTFILTDRHDDLCGELRWT